ncbi:DMT family transporter [Flaviflagellibacter deserti]|uniref:DMT family transporter n=1 Tax=Flaviflagellibacter deserti TaxID=2267266 RepID=A0ABV9Z578_9HYPH
MTSAGTAATPASRPWVGYLFAAAGACLFATKSIIIKLAYAEGIDAETLLALRMVLSLPVYVVIGVWAVRASRGTVTPSPERSRAIFHAIFVGLLGYWVSSWADFKGLEYISAQFERLILFTYPLFVVLFGAAFFHQPVKAKALLAFVVSYAGLALIFNQDLGVLGQSALIGAAWVMAAAVAFALYQLLAKEIIFTLGPQLFTCIAMSAAAVAAIGQFLLTHELKPLSPYVMWLGVLIAVGATVLPSFFMNAALSRISAQANATISTMSPVATIALAVVVLGEGMSLIDVIGSVLVLAGVGFYTLASRERVVVSDD